MKERSVTLFSMTSLFYEVATCHSNENLEMTPARKGIFSLIIDFPGSRKARTFFPIPNGTKYVHIKSTKVYALVGIGTPPQPPTRRLVCPLPPISGGRGTLAGKKGVGRVPIPTRGIHCGTLYMYVLCAQRNVKERSRFPDSSFIVLDK
jgi:hypothetical protein